jgi:hypothetical protein
VTLCARKRRSLMRVLSQFPSQTLFSAILITLNYLWYIQYNNQLLIIPYYYLTVFSFLDATHLFLVRKKARTMAITAVGACPNDKCGFRQCKILVGQEKQPSTGPNCTKLVHLTCYNGLQMMFTGVPKLGGDFVACSKKCTVYIFSIIMLSLT